MNNQIKGICAKEAMSVINNGTLFIDVRELNELSELSFDIPNIINIPLSILEKHIKEIPKDKEVIMVCRGGVRSFRAADILMQNGFTKVSNMNGGIIEWVKNNFPVKRGIN